MKLSSPLIDADTARELLRHLIPDWKELLGELEEAGGRLKFRPILSTVISNLRVESYPLLYECPDAVGVLALQAFMEPDEITAFDSEMAAASPLERGKTLSEIGRMLDGFDSAIEMLESPEGQARAVEDFSSLDEKAQQASVKLMQALIAGGLAMFYEFLSVAVHGERLSALVAQAKCGSDQAFGKAIQIDGRILTVVPYFKARYERASTEDHEDFLVMVSRKRAAPPYVGKINHKSLFMTFAFLDGCGLLSSLTGEQLLDLCDDIGVVGRSGKSIDDVKNLQKRLHQYRKFQSRGDLSTP